MLLALAARVAYADLSASYDGTITLTGTSVAAGVSAALAQVGGAVSGTVTLGLQGTAVAGRYDLQGRVRGRRVLLTGANGTGARLRWRGRLMLDGGVRGRILLRMRRRAIPGALVLARHGGGGAPSCGSAYFQDTVMPQVAEPICARCHVLGGPAQAARFRVTRGNAIATEQSALPLVDAANPDQSRILQKPIGQLGHGGGQQIVPGSAEEQVLQHWVALVTQPGCDGGGPGGGGNPGGGGTTGADLYGANCASCHGPDARGLQGRPDVRCNKRIHDPVRNGRRGTIGEMPAFPDLADADIAAIQAYLDGLCPVDQASGADLYAGSCASCHGSQAAGGQNAEHVRGPDIRCTEAGDFFEKVTRGEGAMPAFPELPAAAIERIAVYVQGFCTGGGLAAH